MRDNTSVRQPLIEDRLCEMGRYGQKTGAGWYKYDENRQPSPRCRGRDRIIAEAPHEARAFRSAKSPATKIVDRTHLCSGERGRANSGGRLRAARGRHRHHLFERLRIPGLSRRPDVVRRHGRAEKSLRPHRGVSNKQHGELWEPAPLLKQLAEGGQASSADFD